MSTHRSWVEILEFGQPVFVDKEVWYVKEMGPESILMVRDDAELETNSDYLWERFAGYELHQGKPAPAFRTGALGGDVTRVWIDEAVQYNGERRRVEIKWSRIGKVYDAGPIDISDLIDLDSIEERIKTEVSKFVVGEFTPILKIQVKISGGQYRELPFGRGSIG